MFRPRVTKAAAAKRMRRHHINTPYEQRKSRELQAAFDATPRGKALLRAQYKTPGETPAYWRAWERYGKAFNTFKKQRMGRRTIRRKTRHQGTR